VSFQPALSLPVDPLEEIEHQASLGGSSVARMLGADGVSYSIQTTYTPIRDEHGEIFAFSVIYHDISEQVADRERIEAEVIARTAELKLRNQALQEAQEAQAITSARMSLLLERLPSGVILISAHDKRISIINRQAVELLQRLGAHLSPQDDPEEAARRLIGQDGERILRSIALYYPSGSLLPYEEHPLYPAMKRGESSEAELHAQLADSQSIYLLVNAAPLRASDGSIESVILVYQDITRLKHLERVREDFFTMMAHELKTPLANIRAHLSALLVNDLHWTREEQFAYLQTADEQVDRLVGMINHFLEASRVEAGALRLELEPIILPELFEDVQERLEALISSAHCTLQITLPESLPAVRGDYELILSVLTNLLSNAFRYAPEGDAVQLRVELVSNGPRQRPHSVRISVIDRGPGISREQQIALFARFSTFAALSRPLHEQTSSGAAERRQKATRWSPATGLGLYISRGIIEAHGSQLELTSSPGHGATFTFMLPIYRSRQTVT
jgi:signal transduction histidine kinase